MDGRGTAAHSTTDLLEARCGVPSPVCQISYAGYYRMYIQCYGLICNERLSIGVTPLPTFSVTRGNMLGDCIR
jgi:hypothetical protein